MKRNGLLIALVCICAVFAFSLSPSIAGDKWGEG